MVKRTRSTEESVRKRRRLASSQSNDVDFHADADDEIPLDESNDIMEDDDNEDDVDEIQPVHRPRVSRNQRARVQQHETDVDFVDVEPAVSTARKRSEFMGDDEGEVEEMVEKEVDLTGDLVAHERNDSDNNGDGDDEEGDDDDGDDDDDESDDAVANIADERDKGFATYGILYSIRLDRIMCHTCFEFELGPNVNIINGDNGAGKSAICVAFILGMGGRPADTDRGRKIDDFIQRGESSGVITIKLLNRKPTASNGVDMTYKHDVYGDFIIIERRLLIGRNNKSGSSTFTVRGKKKPFIMPEGSTARKEVFAIADHFGFNVTNPVAVMGQEKSQKFLANAKPTEHYNLYQEATLLAPWRRELLCTMDVTEKAKRLVKATEEKTPNVERDLEKLEAAHKEAQEMKTIHVRIKEVGLSIAWAEYSELKAELDKKEKKTAEHFEPRCEQCVQRLQVTDQQVEELTTKLEDVMTRINEMTEKTNVSTSQYSVARREKAKIEEEIRRYEGKIRECRAEIASIDRETEVTKARMERSRMEHFKGQEQKTQMLEEMDRLKEKTSSIEEELKKLSDELGPLQAEQYSLQDEANQCQSNRDRRQRVYDERRANFANLQMAMKQEADNHLLRFGRDVPKLVSMIQRNKRQFEIPPIGPFGSFIKVEDESWAAVIEEAIGWRQLTSFIVHSSRDQSVLLNMVKSIGRSRPQIVVTDMTQPRYSVDSNSVPNVHSYGDHTILDLLTVSNDTVFNALIDFSQVEMTVLTNQTDQMRITELAWSNIRNLGTVWSKTGARAYVRNGSSTFRALGREPKSRFLTKDMAPYLDGLRSELENLEANLREDSDKVEHAKRKLNEVNTRLGQINVHRSDLRRQQNGTERRRTELENQLNQAENAFDPSPFEREIEMQEGRKEDHAKQIESFGSELETVKTRTKDMEQGVEDARKKLSAVKATAGEVTREFQGVQDSIASVRSKQRTYKKEYERAKKDLDAAHDLISKDKAIVANSLATANDFGDRPDDLDHTKTSSSMLRRNLTMLQKRLETEQNRRGGKSAGQIEREYLVAKTKYEKDMRKLERVVGYVDCLTNGIATRQQKLAKMGKTLKKVVRFTFRRFLGNRGHDGNIIFASDGKDKGLKITTQMASHKKGDGERFETKDLRSLSGGERSFTTLCFMMSLADATNVPVRIMDEIDVYQDEANRRASYKMLIEFFQEFLSSRQIVVITPHALPDVRPSPNVRIVRLRKINENRDSRRQTQIDSYME